MESITFHGKLFCWTFLFFPFLFSENENIQQKNLVKISVRFSFNKSFHGKIFLFEDNFSIAFVGRCNCKNLKKWYKNHKIENLFYENQKSTNKPIINQ